VQRIIDGSLLSCSFGTVMEQRRAAMATWPDDDDDRDEIFGGAATARGKGREGNIHRSRRGGGGVGGQQRQS
jgi:hypothetical protein